MPSVETTELDQKALLYVFLRHDEHGQPVVSEDLEEIPCRWEKFFEESRSSDSSTQSYNMSLVVDRTIAHESILWEGEEDDLTGTSGFPPSNLFIVRDSDDIPDLKNRNNLRRVYLERFGNTMPTTE